MRKHNICHCISIIFQKYSQTSKKETAKRKFHCQHCPEDFETSEGLSIHIKNCHYLDVMVSYV